MEVVKYGVQGYIAYNTKKLSKMTMQKIVSSCDSQTNKTKWAVGWHLLFSPVDCFVSSIFMVASVNLILFCIYYIVMFFYSDFTSLCILVNSYRKHKWILLVSLFSYGLSTLSLLMIFFFSSLCSCFTPEVC